jgi:uncharacterized membrane protein SpoIIM required for sporulation
MDLDAYVGAHGGQWQRLEDLVRRRRLSGAEADEMLDLYQKAGTHLSVIRSASPDPALVGYLSWLVARARSAAGEPRRAGWRGAVDFLAAGFPAALYRTRRWWMWTLVVNVVVAVVLGWWFLANPGFEASVVSRAEVDRLVNADFENYYSEYAATSFAFRVWTNNAWLAAQCIALGVLGVPIILLLANNVINVAFMGAIMIHHGRGGLFFGLITPHGLLELTAVFVAGGVGLRLFWSWIEPGARSRVQAVAEEGRAAVGVAVGLVLVLLISGGIEAFVTPSPLPTWGRILIGLVAEVAFFAYVFTLGRSAHGRGERGDVAADQQVDVAPARA